MVLIAHNKSTKYKGLAVSIIKRYTGGSSKMMFYPSQLFLKTGINNAIRVGSKSFDLKQSTGARLSSIQDFDSFKTATPDQKALVISEQIQKDPLIVRVIKEINAGTPVEDVTNSTEIRRLMQENVYLNYSGMHKLKFTKKLEYILNSLNNKNLVNANNHFIEISRVNIFGVDYSSFTVLTHSSRSLDIWTASQNKVIIKPIKISSVDVVGKLEDQYIVPLRIYIRSEVETMVFENDNTKENLKDFVTFYLKNNLMFNLTNSINKNTDMLYSTTLFIDKDVKGNLKLDFILPGEKFISSISKKDLENAASFHGVDNKTALVVAPNYTLVGSGNLKIRTTNPGNAMAVYAKSKLSTVSTEAHPQNFKDSAVAHSAKNLKNSWGDLTNIIQKK